MLSIDEMGCSYWQTYFFFEKREYPGLCIERCTQPFVASSDWHTYILLSTRPRGLGIFVFHNGHMPKENRKAIGHVFPKTRKF